MISDKQIKQSFDPKRFETESIPRNLLIASMLYRADYIEKAGTRISNFWSIFELNSDYFRNITGLKITEKLLVIARSIKYYIS